MRSSLAPPLLGILASCGGLGDWGDAEVVVHAVDHDAPRPGLTVFALADDSSRLGSAVTDGRGIARIKVSQAGSMWLAANAGEGRGFVSRVTVQRLGTTDVGERAMTLLDEQPSVFRLKGLGYEERVTELGGQLEAFAVGHGVVLASESFQSRNEWGLTVSRLTLVEAATDGAGETTLLLDTDRAHGALGLKALGDGRYLEVVVPSPPGTSATVKWYDSELRRFVHEVAFDGTAPGGSRLVNGVLTTPVWRDDGAGNTELRVSRFDPRTSQASTNVVWSPRRGLSYQLAAVFGQRVVATSGDQGGVTELATFDAVTLVRLGGFSTESTQVAGVTNDGATAVGLRQLGALAEVLQFDTLTGAPRLITSHETPCGSAELSSALPDSRLLALQVRAGCDSADHGTAALIGGEGASGFRVLPSTGLPDAVFAHPLGDAPVLGGSAPLLWTVSATPSGDRLEVWGFAAEAWTLVWRSEPSLWPMPLQTTSGTEHYVRANPQGALGPQLVAIDQVLSDPVRPSVCHTWARLPRGSAGSTGSMTYYSMVDPLTGRDQVFRSALCEGLTP